MAKMMIWSTDIRWVKFTVQVQDMESALTLWETKTNSKTITQMLNQPKELSKSQTHPNKFCSYQPLKVIIILRITIYQWTAVSNQK